MVHGKFSCYSFIFNILSMKNQQMEVISTSARQHPAGKPPLTPPYMSFGIRRFPGNAPRAVVLESLSSAVRLSISSPGHPLHSVPLAARQPL